MTPSALDARCPYCHAGPGHFCRDRSGNTRHAHETRKTAARTDVPALVAAVRQRDDDLARLRSVAQSAAVLLRAVADRHPADADTYRAAARALDDTATTTATTGA